jgi:hypothetical protein
MSDLAQRFRIDMETETDGNALERLKDMAEEASKLETIVSDLETDLKQAKASLRQLTQELIPQLMDDLGITEITAGNHKVALEDFVSGALPAEPHARKRALEWLEAHDGSGIIKSDVVVPFSRTDHERATRLANVLKQDGYDAHVQSSVHHMTLKSYIRERLEKGEDIDLEALGVYTGRIAKIK